CDQPLAPSEGVSSTLHQTDTQGFDRATEVRPFHFPADHGPHGDFRDEWWYVTGNLDGPKGQRFGFQITFFRHGLQRGKRPGASHWAGQDAWMAHVALTDVTGQRYHSFQRISREGVGLAGARAEPFKVWLDDWSIEGAAEGGYPWRFKAQQEGIALDLELNPIKLPALQGDRGLSQKSREPGNASYYYSITRMVARGTLRLAGEPIPVSGLAWLDREWSTSMLAPDQAGWDWFSLQMDDGTDLMYFRMRNTEGGDDPLSSGAVIAGDGTTQHLNLKDVALKALDSWASPAWGVLIPKNSGLTAGDIVYLSKRDKSINIQIEGTHSVVNVVPATGDLYPGVSASTLYDVALIPEVQTGYTFTPTGTDGGTLFVYRPYSAY
ncbi:MAG: hypothetical protein EB012_13015, partial [Gammaproteobacteria bacterium]|nr:hypothetical protein [Gammaproteobacteria bacterium]